MASGVVESPHSQTYLILVALRFVLAIFQTGYIHPDEYLQSLEPVAGRWLGINVTLPWEFSSRLPLRSWSALLLSAGPPVLLAPQRHLLAATRIWMCTMSLLVDLSVAASARLLGRNVDQCLCTLASSAALLIFASRPFSNTLELTLTALLLWRALAGASDTYRALAQLRRQRRLLAERGDYAAHRLRVLEARERLHKAAVSEAPLIGALSALGVFVRPTFAVFAAVPATFWLFSGACSDSEEFGVSAGGSTCSKMRANRSHNHVDSSSIVAPTGTSSGDEEGLVRARLVRIVPTMIAVGLSIIALDSLLYGWLTIDQLLTLDISYHNIVLTPFNFIVYNVRTDNLAAHGLHWRGQLALLHLPLLFTSLAVLLVLELPALAIALGRHLVTINSSHSHHWSSTGGYMLAAASLFPLAVLSMIRHQEARFLLPLLVPLVLLFGERLQLVKQQPASFSATAAPPASTSATSSGWRRKWKRARAVLATIWWVSSAVTVLVWGFAHQGGMWNTLATLRRIVSTADSVTPLSSVSVSDDCYNVSAVFSHTYPPPQSVLALPVASCGLHVYDLAGKPIPSVVDVLSRLKRHQHSGVSSVDRQRALPIQPNVMLVLPTTLERQLLRLAAARRLRVNVWAREWPHLNSEAPPQPQLAVEYCSGRRQRPLGVGSGMWCVGKHLLGHQLSLSLINIE